MKFTVHIEKCFKLFFDSDSFITFARLKAMKSFEKAGCEIFKNFFNVRFWKAFKALLPGFDKVLKTLRNKALKT